MWPSCPICSYQSFTLYITLLNVKPSFYLGPTFRPNLCPNNFTNSSSPLSTLYPTPLPIYSPSLLSSPYPTPCPSPIYSPSLLSSPYPTPCPSPIYSPSLLSSPYPTPCPIYSSTLCTCRPGPKNCLTVV